MCMCVKQRKKERGRERESVCVYICKALGNILIIEMTLKKIDKKTKNKKEKLLTLK